MTDQAPPPRRGVKVALGILGALAVALAAGTALQIDDWSRDLTTNHASTSRDAPDAALRSIETPVAGDALARVVAETGQELGWEVVSSTQTGPAAWTVHLVRTTRLFRFRDDITVTVTDRGATRLLDAGSRSRVGKGDLGQNPRNLRALLERVRAKL